MRRTTMCASAALLISLAVGCGDPQVDSEGLGIFGNVKVAPLEGGGPQARPTDPEMQAKPGGPVLGVIQMAVHIYERPDHRSDKVGYLRLGVTVRRGTKPAAFDSCQGGFYNILPRGYVCLDDGATIDLNHPLIRAGLKQANRDHPLPYDYAFVRAIAPRYYRLPSEKEQFKYEMSLKRHLRSFKRLKQKWNAIEVGSNDVPIDEIGNGLGPAPEDPPELTEGEKFGGDGSDAIPWFFDGKRKLPNVSNFKVPDYAVITNRIKRHAGVALIDAFEGEGRHFALTTDLRLIPTSKLKPGRGSPFHGVELVEGWELPVGFVKRDRAYDHEKRGGRFKKLRKRYAYGAAIQLTGEVRRDGSRRYVETEDGSWMRTRDLAISAKLSKLPRHAKDDTKWIDVSIHRQILTLFEGKTPIYTTMVSTGKDGLGDPRRTHSTPRGTFRVRDKHITNTMDSQVLGSEFELNDVPWVQYFKAGYALHAAYWHTEYGRPRSHGCINLSPIDAYRIFRWTEPRLPEGWHGVSVTEGTGKGTIIHVQP
ncbi:MAG: L,D-transpeptidase [Deltaproteobacteria bacterium]|nr:MAG: L,D-transpeptidase [Deltaproteobacteria bacterium]